MPIPTTIESLSTTAASNGPAGSDDRSTADDGLRQAYAFIKQGVSLGSNIASASSITPASTASVFNVTGTTTINSIASTNSWDGRVVTFIFAGALTLTHSSNLVLPGAVNVLTEANHIATFIQTASGAWRCTAYVGLQTLTRGRADSNQNFASLALGISTLQANTTGQTNTAVGYQNLKANTTGLGNSAFGVTALLNNTVGNYNTAIGLDALYTNVAGYSNTAVGADTLGFNVDGRENAAVGFNALYSNTYGNNSTAIGFKSLYSNLTGSNNVAIGNFAGYYETGSNAFYVDNRDRTNTAGDKAGALLYGTFNATPASQTLVINGSVTVPAPTSGNTFTASAASGAIAYTALVPAASVSYGFQASNGTASFASFFDASNNTYFGATSNHASIWRSNNINRVTLSAAGNLVVATPTSGYGLNIPTATPASAGAAGTAGDISWDTSYIYVCTASNTWKRAALSTW